ncbi:MAG TPA: hypothetical protein VEW07_08090 [Solirubrobacterales bacterium]|nr:hypothetical protein [Solirubrobacterales bacterium]
MEAMRQSWSDDRLDHLSYRVDEGFCLAAERSDRIEAEMNHRFDRVDDRFDRLEDRFDRLQQGIMIVGGGLVCSLIATLGGFFVSLN